jgi:acetyl esterase/lipase
MSDEYRRALESLAAGARLFNKDGLEIEIRDCAGRVQGRLDPRAALVLGLGREEFEKNFSRYDKALWPNGIHIFGPRNTEGRTGLELFRAAFGWNSGDISRNVETSCFCVPSKWGPVPVYRYEGEHKNGACLVFFHGGGFFAGNVKTVENQCKLIAERAGALVLSVDYPLAPESPYPIGFDSCYAAVEYALANAAALGIDAAKIGVAGDSAGGNLALACALRNRDEGRRPLAYQALIYPVLSRAEKPGDPGWRWDPSEFDNPENDPVIEAQCRFVGELNHDMNRWYVPKGEQLYGPYLHPIGASAAALPKTLIVTAEYDFLRPECEKYTAMLKKAGVPCRHIRYGGVAHGTFDRLGYAPQAEDMVNEIVKDLRTL